MDTFIWLHPLTILPLLHDVYEDPTLSSDIIAPMCVVSGPTCLTGKPYPPILSLTGLVKRLKSSFHELRYSTAGRAPCTQPERGALECADWRSDVVRLNIW